MAQFEGDALDRKIAVFRETELEVRGKPFRLEGEAGLLHFLDHVGEILLDEMRQHEAVVQLGAPARQPLRRVGLLPETRDQRPQLVVLGLERRQLVFAQLIVARHVLALDFQLPLHFLDARIQQPFTLGGRRVRHFAAKRLFVDPLAERENLAVLLVLQFVIAVDQFGVIALLLFDALLLGDVDSPEIVQFARATGRQCGDGAAQEQGGEMADATSHRMRTPWPRIENDLHDIQGD
ncbi:MAG: hypothetical protein BWZ10_00191 [candidate division BRC1 bacterium ADurb.BinA364]|nr:MAG: hypothetical protein BWZ10_00191 [candidate division BRC1 bacterium ADurb.BinA364]